MDTAREIINALRNGTVPNEGLEYLATGIVTEIQELTNELDYISSGHSSIRFIHGEYGSGKTFLSLKYTLSLHDALPISGWQYHLGDRKSVV